MRGIVRTVPGSNDDQYENLPALLRTMWIK